MTSDEPVPDEFEMLVAAYRGLPSTIETRLAEHDNPSSMPDYRARNALARSLVEHRPFCGDCQPDVDAIALALDGATIDDVREVEQP